MCGELIGDGDTYVFDEHTSEQYLVEYWFPSRPRHETWVVADDHDECQGCFVIRPNQIGRGNHIANCSYMVARDARGKGLGRYMATFSLDRAAALNFHAIQFNCVVESNPAVALWESLGFTIIGRTPNGFRHSSKGLVDSLIMYRPVNEGGRCK
jgi:RimJ/RimL family protein N-acetyltransferase